VHLRFLLVALMLVLQRTSKWRAGGAVKRHELTAEERQLLAQSARPAEQRSQTLDPQQSAPSFESNYACNR